MLDRSTYTVDHLGGDDGVEIFGRPVLLAGRFHAAIDRARGLVAAYLAAGVEQHGDERLEVRRRDRAVDEQRLGRAADAGAPHLGIEQDRARHVELRRTVHVDVANALEMREDRHARLRLHARDQALATAWNDDVDRAVEAGEHHPDRGTVARRYEG